MKNSSLLWLIAHRAVWTRAKAAKCGKGDGVCPRCQESIEDLKHLFFDCPHNLKFFNFLKKCFRGIKLFRLSANEVLLGECFHLDILLWHNIRGSLLFNIWKERNSSLFTGGSTSHILIIWLKSVLLLCRLKVR